MGTLITAGAEKDSARKTVLSARAPIFLLSLALTTLLTAGSLAAYASTSPASQWMRTEQGFVQMATFALALAASGMAVAAALMWEGSRKGKAWLILLAIGGFYWGGEEVSWGQQLWGFETPAAYAKINAQNETTLHNIEFDGPYRRGLRMVVDYLPRSAVTVCAILCLAAPFVGRWKSRRLAPHIACIPPALAVILLDAKVFGAIPEGGEVTELLMAVMLCVYLALMLADFRRRSRLS